MAENSNHISGNWVKIGMLELAQGHQSIQSLTLKLIADDKVHLTTQQTWNIGNSH